VISHLSSLVTASRVSSSVITYIHRSRIAYFGKLIKTHLNHFSHIQGRVTHPLAPSVGVSAVLYWWYIFIDIDTVRVSTPSADINITNNVCMYMRWISSWIFIWCMLGSGRLLMEYSFGVCRIRRITNQIFIQRMNGSGRLPIKYSVGVCRDLADYKLDI